jgi:hypothetical protein
VLHLACVGLPELTHEESEKFCKRVYLLRKRGCSVAEAQVLSYRMVLADSIDHALENDR